MASSSKQQPEEFIVRVPPLNKNKKVEILKFNANLNVDVTQWSNVSMAREDNAAVYVNPDDQPKTGVGSEFGKNLRDEARRKKLGYDTKKYKRDDQPWLLNVNTVTATSKTTKKYRGIREGGVTQNADFWVFVKAGEGVFDAYPVDEWYNFLPVARYKTLDADEAEEQFSRRNKILNQFALKAKINKDEIDDDEEDAGGDKKKSKNRNDDGGTDKKKKKPKDSDDEVEPTKAVKFSKSKKKKAVQKKVKKKRGSDAEEGDMIASAESDDGDDEGREVDYMSDSELSASSDEEPEDEKVDKALRGVDEEDGMRKLIASDDEEEEGEQEEGEGDDKKKVDLSKMESMPSIGAFGGPEENDSDSGSDSDDPDKEDIKSALFLQEKKPVVDETNGKQSSAAQTPATSASGSGTSSGQKRKADDSGSPVPSKKTKSERSSKSSHGGSSSGGITEDEVRRYLQRKPLSTTDLVAKFKPRCQGMGKQEIVRCLADILKRLQPEQFRRKDVLYFSLKKS